MAKSRKVKLQLEIDQASITKMEKTIKGSFRKALKGHEDAIDELSKTLNQVQRYMMNNKTGRDTGGSSFSQRISNVGKEMEVTVKKITDKDYSKHIKDMSDYLEKIEKHVSNLHINGVKTTASSEGSQIEIEQLKTQRAQYDFERQHLSATWRQTSFNERKKLLIMDHQAKMQRMLNRSFLSILNQNTPIGGISAIFGGLAAQLPMVQQMKDLLAFQKFEEKGKVEQLAMGKSPTGLAQANAMLSSADFSTGIEKLMLMQETFLGRNFRQQQKILPIVIQNGKKFNLLFFSLLIFIF